MGPRQVLEDPHLTALMFLGYSLTGRGNTEEAKIKAVRWGKNLQDLPHLFPVSKGTVFHRVCMASSK